MLRASSFVYKPNKTHGVILHQLCYARRKLWNVGNYEKRNWTKDSGVPYPDWYEQKKRLKSHFWYKKLPSQSAQEVLKVLQESWPQHARTVSSLLRHRQEEGRQRSDDVGTLGRIEAV